MKKSGLLFVMLLTFLSSCTEYNKILKEKDMNKKFQAAVQYYKDGECQKALPLLEELQGPTRGSSISEDVQYYYAMTNLCNEDYVMAGYYLKAFSKNYPRHAKSEECLFKSAYCSYRLSPDYTLDQTETQNAINDFQFFLDRYPNSSMKDSANVLVSKLNFKLEKKDFENAKLYVKTEKYKAASIALKQFIHDYPTSQFREEVQYLIVKSNYLLAVGSIDSKKLERFRATTESYINFANAYPESEWLKSAQDYFDKCAKQIEKLTQSSL
jgi:outer membrane protein assembly factor BamD